MASDRAFERLNRDSRARLEAAVSRLGDRDRPLPGGWTVAGTLAHLAFWDLRAAALAARPGAEAGEPSPIDVDVVNETVLRLARALEPRAAGRLAVDAARAADAAVEALPDGVIARIRVAGGPFSLDRHVHRLEHLDEIEPGP